MPIFEKLVTHFSLICYIQNSFHAMANRLKTVLATIIADAQSGFMAGRFIVEDTCLV